MGYCPFVPTENDPLPKTSADVVAVWWQEKSKAFRVWVFGSFLWVVVSVLFFMLVDPDSIWSNALGGSDMGLVIFPVLVPPLISGTAYFGYQKFVK